MYGVVPALRERASVWRGLCYAWILPQRPNFDALRGALALCISKMLKGRINGHHGYLHTIVHVYGMKTQLQLSIDTDLKQRLATLSGRSGVSIARLIDGLLREHLEQLEEKYPSVDPHDQLRNRRRVRH